MKRKKSIKSKNSLYSNDLKLCFPFNFNKTTMNERFIYYKFLSLKLKTFIYLGLTIYKHFLLRCLNIFCVFDFNQLYRVAIQHIVVTLLLSEGLNE